MTSRATDFLRYRVAVSIVLQLDRWPNKSTGANPIILKWASGQKNVVCIRVRRPIQQKGRDRRVEVTVCGRIRKVTHNDVLRETPAWLAVLGEITTALTVCDD